MQKAICSVIDLIVMFMTSMIIHDNNKIWLLLSVILIVINFYPIIIFHFDKPNMPQEG